MGSIEVGLMNFEEWKQWKEAQTTLTCDKVGCKEASYWVLPKQQIFFCVKHAAELGGSLGLQAMYSEIPEPI